MIPYAGSVIPRRKVYALKCFHQRTRYKSRIVMSWGLEISYANRECVQCLRLAWTQIVLGDVLRRDMCIIIQNLANRLVNVLLQGVILRIIISCIQFAIVPSVIVIRGIAIWPPEMILGRSILSSYRNLLRVFIIKIAIPWGD